MRKSYRNLILLALAIYFSTFNLIVESANAQTRSSTKAAKTAKTDSKSTPKPTPKKTAADAPQPDSEKFGQIIVTATNVIVHQEESVKSARLSAVKLGQVLPVVKKGSAFYQVEYEKGKNGWISTTYTRDFAADKREAVYREIAAKYLKSKTVDYANASEITDFLRTAAALVKTDEARADLSFKRLQFIAAALKAIPSGKGEQFPYKNFIKANEKDCVYSEPSAEWYVRADSFWELHEKFIKTPQSEEIAWTAANTPIPGECEGYINCYLFNIRATDGEYLNFYPNGKYAQKALINIANYLEPLVADIKEKKVYTPPSDISDRAEFNRFLTEIRAIISKVPNIEKNKILKQINDLGEGYK